MGQGIPCGAFYVFEASPEQLNGLEIATKYGKYFEPDNKVFHICVLPPRQSDLNRYSEAAVQPEARVYCWPETALHTVLDKAGVTLDIREM